MTIKDIFDTPINEMWSVISPFAIGYLIFFGLFFVAVISFIIFVAVKIIKGHREFERMQKRRIR